MTALAEPTTRRPGRATRVFGYLVAVAVDVVLLYLIHGRPGWDAVPFLSDATPEVLPYVDASILVSALVNLVYVVRDTPTVRQLGELLSAAVALVSLVQIWRVWPFDFSGVWGGWQPLVYAGLAVATFGTAVSAVVQVGRLVRGAS